VLVFVSTRVGAARLSRWLEKAGVAATAIHGDKTQQERLVALDGFKDGTIRVLVATDVAARGLDIEELPLVVNYELPDGAENYVHRIGRTGRAGASGEAISLVAPDEREQLQAIEKLLKMKLKVVPLPDVGPVERARPPREERRERGNTARRRESPHGADVRPMRQQVANDPIFTQPYVPSEPGEDHGSAPASGHPARAGERAGKAIPALLLPPVPVRQDG